MIPALLGHLWQSTWFAGGALVLALMLRPNRAQTIGPYRSCPAALQSRFGRQSKRRAVSIGPFELARLRLRGTRQLWDLLRSLVLSGGAVARCRSGDAYPRGRVVPDEGSSWGGMRSRRGRFGLRVGGPDTRILSAQKRPRCRRWKGPTTCPGCHSGEGCCNGSHQASAFR